MSEQTASPLALEHFAGRVGERFSIAATATESLKLTLSRASELGGDSDAREPFSVVFLGPMEPILPQAIYALDHAELGTLSLFLVPLGPDREQTGIQYEAVFS